MTFWCNKLHNKLTYYYYYYYYFASYATDQLNDERVAVSLGLIILINLMSEKKKEERENKL